MSHVRMRCTLGCQWVRPSLPCTASAHNTFFTHLCIQHVPIVKLNFSKRIKSKELHARFHYILEKSAKMNKEDLYKSTRVLYKHQTMMRKKFSLFRRKLISGAKSYM